MITYTMPVHGSRDILRKSECIRASRMTVAKEEGDTSMQALGDQFLLLFLEREVVSPSSQERFCELRVTELIGP